MIWFEERTKKEHNGHSVDHQEAGLVEEDARLKEDRSDMTSCDEMLIWCENCVVRGLKKEKCDECGGFWEDMSLWCGNCVVRGSEKGRIDECCDEHEGLKEDRKEIGLKDGDDDLNDENDEDVSSDEWNVCDGSDECECADCCDDCDECTDDNLDDDSEEDCSEVCGDSVECECDDSCDDFDGNCASIGALHELNDMSVTGVSCAKSELRKRPMDDLGLSTVDVDVKRKRAMEGSSGCVDLTSGNGSKGGETDIVVQDARVENHVEVEIVDLTMDDGDDTGVGGTHNVVVSDVNATQDRCKAALVWGGEASAEDVVEIKRMLCSGSGVYGHWNCKLELKDSLLTDAGKGVFLKAGCTLRNGECVTEYSGKRIKSARGLSSEEELRTIETEHLMIKGTNKLTEGDGFGSFVNSSVTGRTLSFCRFVSFNNRVYMMASYKKDQYILQGSIELYLTAGHAWWSLFNSLKQK